MSIPGNFLEDNEYMPKTEAERLVWESAVKAEAKKLADWLDAEIVRGFLND